MIKKHCKQIYQKESLLQLYFYKQGFNGEEISMAHKDGHFPPFLQLKSRMAFAITTVEIFKIPVAFIRNLGKRRVTRKFWVHPINRYRHIDGEAVKINKMYSFYPDKFFQYTRLTPPLFDMLFEKVAPSIRKKDTTYRESISARTRLYITLRYLATGDNMRTIATNFSVGKSTVWTILMECIPAIWKALMPEYLQWPSDQRWETIIHGFNSTWNFPNCLGAMDGKHVVIEAPPKSGSLYLNYKGTFSIVLLAVCDHDYKFTYVDVGGYGKQSDGGVLTKSALGRGLNEGTLQLPVDRNLPNSSIPMPCHFVADEAFPLGEHIMRPYSKRQLNRTNRIFNYRLSRARRIIENAFGIMAARFRIFRKAITTTPSQAEHIVLAAVCLHNFIKTEEARESPQNRFYCPPGFADCGYEDNGAWRREGASDGLLPMQRRSVAAQDRLLKQRRETLADYFIGSGAVGWQNDHVDMNSDF